MMDKKTLKNLEQHKQDWETNKIKTNIYPVRRGSMPFSACSVTNGRKAIQSLITYGGQSIF
jgi:hypothetical protein